MSDNIPFDFGSWQVHEQCPKHGSVTGVLAIRIKARHDEQPIIRRYCPLCVIDALDAFCTSFDEK